jgi:Family of unknown function (DUF6527)
MSEHEKEYSADLRPAAPDFRDLRREFGPTLTAGSQTEARALLMDHADQVVVVRRGQARAVLFMCPNGCGDLVTVNVDPGAGRAWRLREGSDGSITLLPSIWRSSGCYAHFVVWRSRIWWCRTANDDDTQDGDDSVGCGDAEWTAGMAAELREEWRRIRVELLRRR